MLIEIKKGRQMAASKISAGATPLRWRVISCPDAFSGKFRARQYRGEFVVFTTDQISGFTASSSGIILLRSTSAPEKSYAVADAKTG
ncbi:hypothetical protein [Erwinia typographi]|uniref:hypothetical protein n=1 Tax=Erwinia typographi TaxID=371042 RepID=UPI000ACD39C2|nr:hypothetical protein [Erwinia typographi]